MATVRINASDKGHDMTSTCSVCGRRDLEVTVTFDKHDPVSIIRALREVADPWALKVAAQAIASDGIQE